MRAGGCDPATKEDTGLIKLVVFKYLKYISLVFYYCSDKYTWDGGHGNGEHWKGDMGRGDMGWGDTVKGDMGKGDMGRGTWEGRT